MAKTRLPYAPEFRRQIVEFVHAGRTPEELEAEFEPTAQSIRNWVAQSERNAGRGDGGLTTAEREELNRLTLEPPKALSARHCIWSNAVSRRMRPICCGWPISLTFRHGPDFSIWLSCWIRCSRRIVGWSMATTLATQLVLDAREHGAGDTGEPCSVIHHSDQGSQGGFN